MKFALLWITQRKLKGFASIALEYPFFLEKKLFFCWRSSEGQQFFDFVSKIFPEEVFSFFGLKISSLLIEFCFRYFSRLSDVFANFIEKPLKSSKFTFFLKQYFGRAFQKFEWMEKKISLISSIKMNLIFIKAKIELLFILMILGPYQRFF